MGIVLFQIRTTSLVLNKYKNSRMKYKKNIDIDNDVIFSVMMCGTNFLTKMVQKPIKIIKCVKCLNKC